MQTDKKSERHTEPVSENPAWVQFEFYSRRLGFLILILIVLSGLGGLFSDGHLSERTRSSADGSLLVNYQRFNRLMTDTDLTLYLSPQGKDTLSITLGGDFMKTFRIDTLQPQPNRMYSDRGTLILEYDAINRHSTLQVWFNLIPLKPGATRHTVNVNNQAGVTFRQFIYP